MDTIKNDGKTNRVEDMLNLLHTTHPKRSDGTPSLWCIKIHQEEGLAEVEFDNLSMGEFVERFNLHPFKHKVTKSDIGPNTDHHIFWDLDGDKVPFQVGYKTGTVTHSYTNGTAYYFHGDEWKNHFD